MNQIKEFSFKNTISILGNEDCNIWDEDALEGERKNSSVRQSSLQQNMESNSFSKYDKTYKLNNIKKFKSHGDVAELRSVDQISLRNRDIHSENDTRIGQRMSLKDEVSLLLKELVTLKKNRKVSDPEPQISLNDHSLLEVNIIKEEDEFVTMRQIVPAEINHIF